MPIEQILKRGYPALALVLVAVAAYYQARGMAQLLATKLFAGRSPSNRGEVSLRQARAETAAAPPRALPAPPRALPTPRLESSDPAVVADLPKVVGLRLSGIRPGSLLSVLGLQNGDRLESINGFRVASPAQALDAYVHLRTAPQLRVQLRRLEAAVVLNLNIN